jgi:hypothetical protein
VLDVTRKLLGLPCWGVRRGTGSFITLEFGEPYLVVREPVVRQSSLLTVRRSLSRRSVKVHGAWHLWIYCCEWKVESGGRCVGDSSTSRRVDRAVEVLDGQKLIGVVLATRGARTRFIFDLGAVLETRPYDRRSEQWMLFTPTHQVLTFRADRRYSLTRANGTGEETWRAA